MKKAAALFLLFLLLSCKNSSTSIIYIYSELPETSTIINVFNKNNERIKVTLTTEINESDLVIYRGQYKDPPIETLDLKKMFNTKIDRTLFYTDLIDSIYTNEGIKFIPLSFNIPGIVYSRSQKNISNIIKIEDFVNEDSVFSPFWNEEFILWYFLSNFPELKLDERLINEEDFTKIKSMINRVYESKKQWNEEEFNKKYLHLSPIYLLKNNFIDYYYLTLREYNNLNKEEKKILNFSALENNGLIIANDYITYVGIRKNSKQVPLAENFITWIFNKENQEKIIADAKSDVNSPLMFLGELSTLKEVSQYTIPDFFKYSYQLIPNPEMITSSGNYPELWESLRKNVLLPLFKNLKNQNYQQWRNSQEEYYIDWAKKHNK